MFELREIQELATQVNLSSLYEIAKNSAQIGKEILNKQTNFIIKDRVTLKNAEYEVKCIIDDIYQNFMTLFFLKVPNEKKINMVDTNIKYLNDSLAILGHEISNPITTIKIATDLIKK